MATPIPYNPPLDLDLSQVEDLTPSSRKKVELKPETPVVCRNRGPRRLEDMWDAEPYVIQPHVMFRVPYAAAQHFQKRQIVPGTRNPRADDPTAPQYVSWIAILGVDPEVACEPFNDDFLRLVGEQTEGLNREALPEADRDVIVARTSELRRALPGSGNASSLSAMAAEASGFQPGAGSGRAQSIEGGSAENREKVLEPVQGSDASEAVAEAMGSGSWAPPEHVPDRSARTSDEIAAAITGNRSHHKKR